MERIQIVSTFRKVSAVIMPGSAAGNTSSVQNKRLTEVPVNVLIPTEVHKGLEYPIDVIKEADATCLYCLAFFF